MNNRSLLFKVVGLVALLTLLASCAPAPTAAPAPATQASAPATQASAPATVAPAATTGKAQDVVTWWEFDQNNKDPNADEHVGNFALAAAIPEFNQTFAGQWNWVNVQKAFDQKDAELIAAVQAGGEVPDVFETEYGVNTFYLNGTLQDLTAWAKAQPWFSSLDPSSLTVCTGPDGKLYCIPVGERPQVVYVWKDLYPNGFPTSQADFMTQAAALKAKGKYALSFFGSTYSGGDGITRGPDDILQSFGGSVDDGHGKMVLNTPQNIAAITFMRTIVADGYVPDIAFAGNFQEESAFNDSSAGAFPTGIDGYSFMNPLTAPSGKKYNAHGNQDDFLDAVTAGDIYLSTFFSAVPGQKPGCNVQATALSIPVGAKNVAGGQAYINWIMSSQEDAKFVYSLGAYPALTTAQSDPLFNKPYYTEAAKVLTEEICKPWYGTLKNPAAAQPVVMNAVYTLIKQNPTADIAQTLTQTQDEYNANNP